MPKKKSSKTTKKNSSRISQKKKKQISYGVIAGILLASLFIIYVGFFNLKRNTVSTFEECISAGNSIVNSNPRECIFEGKSYLESITKVPPQIIQIKKGVNDLPLDFERGNYVINSNEEWNMLFSGTKIMPDIDFNKKTVIAVVMGQKPSGGYSVMLEQVEVGDSHIELMVKETVPGDNCMTTQALTNPYQIIAIEKTDKEIQFVENTITEDCSES